jgi:tRNA-(ms[2]io[6]A)-hydroxylase
MVSEAGHYTTFISLARKYGKGIDVEKRWQDLVAFEAELITKYGTHGSIHG